MKMMMTNENAKTSLFPRRSRPVADHSTGRTRKKAAVAALVVMLHSISVIRDNRGPRHLHLCALSRRHHQQ